ncbi:heme peroxidase [Sistotremastrum suecicum HHB10207 ss-3]|uniref:Heme peroxidase n=1 Tax=Sistotremastrum suecicum HHB10207 ss-3 TaxID=1314776 RepID=A0A166BQS3_9AGAM|nr:heme peroxidase [Sistotremastrum suecicum HHB10207 ss-3]
MSPSDNPLAAAFVAHHLSSRPLAVSPDGRYEPAESEIHDPLLNALSKIDAQLKRGDPIIHDPKMVDSIKDAIIHSDKLDDRKMLFQNALAILQKLDPASQLSRKMNDIAITTLYQDLPHPPTTFMGSQFREADGGNNNPHLPNLGRAGQPYARSVQGKYTIPYHELPDPGLVFDTLLRRRHAEPHPGGNSSMTFAFASIITHSLFRTDPKNPNVNNTSSYLDLSPLYGVDTATQKAVRLQDGSGKLHPDVFAEERLMLLPPSVSALLVIFNRNHNYVAQQLLCINERQAWRQLSSFRQDDPALLQQDEEIFQTARLINCGHFMGVVFGDYVAGFLGLTRSGSSWSMNPFDMIKNMEGQLGRGEGNHVSVEFNLLYRWHAIISPEDEKWTKDLFEHQFGTTDFDSVDLSTLGQKIASAHKSNDPDPRHRKVGNLSRGPDGKFDDEQLARVLHDATESPAARFGARGTPPVLRVVEIGGIVQARKWGVCTMNEFRTFLGLKPFASFEEWNPDPEIAHAARQLYKHIDCLELYVGLQAEETMPLAPGSGFCCGYTMTRAILADAISLVRGDRFFTTDYTPANLTAWGYNDCIREPENGAFGSALARLLLRNLPQNYSYNSVYGLMPFFTPSATAANMKELGCYEKYDYSRPQPGQKVKLVRTMQGISQVFGDPIRYKVPYTRDLNYLTENAGMFLIFDDEAKHNNDRKLAMHALFPDGEAMERYRQYYRAQTEFFLKSKSYKLSLPNGSPRYVDIVQNVINMTSVHWACDQLCGISLKTEQNPRGIFSEQEAYDMFMILFTCVFENTDAEHGWFLRETAKKASEVVNKFIRSSLQEASSKSRFSSVRSLLPAALTGGDEKPCVRWMRELVKSELPIERLTGLVIGLAVGSSVNYAQQCSQIVDFYLSPERATEFQAMVKLARRSDPQAKELLIGYIKEAQRLFPQFPALTRVATSDDLIKQGGDVPDVIIEKGDKVVGAYYLAHTNPADFPDPMKVNPQRPREKYGVQGIGFHGCPGVKYAEETLTEVIRVIFSLKNLRRAPEPMGVLSGFDVSNHGVKQHVFIDAKGKLSPWPGSLVVVWDDETD